MRIGRLPSPPRALALAAAAALAALALAPPPAAAGVTLRARFDRVLAEGGDWLMDDTNDAGNLAWGESYVMMALLAAYLDELARHADAVLASRDSERGVTDYRGRSEACWQATRPDYTAEPYCFAVHTGMIASPMVEAAAVILADPALSARPAPGGQTLGDRARAFIEAGQAAAAVHADELRTEGEDLGYYVYRTDATFLAAGQKVPLNMMNAMGLLHLALHAATGDADHLERARRLANHLRASLTIATDGGYAWNYRAGPYVAPGEDVSHAALNVAFAARAAAAGVVFDEDDLRRLAITFWRAWIDNDRSYDHVGGSGSQNGGPYRLQLGRWAVLAAIDPSIHAAVRDMYAGVETTASGSLLLAMALLAETDLPVRGHDFYVADWRDDGDERVATAANANLVVAPDRPDRPQLFRLRYRSSVPFDVEQWDGETYHVVAELPATGGEVRTAHVAYHPELFHDYGGHGALFQLTGPAGIAVLEPEPAEPPAFLGEPPTEAIAGERYAHAPEVSGTGPLRFSLEADPALEVELDPDTGALSFTPPAAGSYRLALAVESDHGEARQEWTVAAADPDGEGGPGPGEEAGGCAAAGSAAGAPLVLLALCLLRARSARRPARPRRRAAARPG
ncbi:MAG TPA: hypothetical protein VKZ63_22510 [Kofleriaceae bacterium]|nr:hypothetical protein [Kofleriaceae bacterium]